VGGHLRASGDYGSLAGLAGASREDRAMFGPALASTKRLLVKSGRQFSRHSPATLVTNTIDLMEDLHRARPHGQAAIRKVIGRRAPGWSVQFGEILNIQRVRRSERHLSSRIKYREVNGYATAKVVSGLLQLILDQSERTFELSRFRENPGYDSAHWQRLTAVADQDQVAIIAACVAKGYTRVQGAAVEHRTLTPY